MSEQPSEWVTLPGFKLRFATAGVLGRSRVSPLRPPRLPCPFPVPPGAREPPVPGEQEALERVTARWTLTPRQCLSRPQLTSQQYGWYADCAAQLRATAWNDRRVRRPIADSPWLKSALAILHDRQGK